MARGFCLELFLSSDLTYRYGAVCSGGSIAGIDERHRFQIIGAVEGRLAVLFQPAKEFGHRPDKSVGKPSLLPVKYSG